MEYREVERGRLFWQMEWSSKHREDNKSKEFRGR